MKAAALLVLAVGFAATLLVAPWHDESVTDLPLYSAYADLFLAGHLPYRDVLFEYPPLAAPLIAVSGLAGGADGYRVAFTVVAFVAAAVVMLLCGELAARTGGDRDRALLAASLAPLLCGAMIRTHFDLVPVGLTLAALALVCGGRPRTGLSVLGAAIALKLYPVVVVPVVLAWLAARGQRRAAIDGALAMALVVAVAYAAAAALSVGGTVDSLTYHVDRAVQVESSPAVVLRALDGLGAGGATPNSGHKSDGLDHPAAAVVTGVFVGLMVAAVALLALAAVRAGGTEPPDGRALVIASLAATVAFACFGKVLSPQFLIWVVPLGALAFAWRLSWLTAAVVVSLALTFVEFPAHYRDVVDRVPWVLGVVVARDISLIAVVGLALRALSVRSAQEPARGSARSPWHARRARLRSAPH